MSDKPQEEEFTSSLKIKFQQKVRGLKKKNGIILEELKWLTAVGAVRMFQHGAFSKGYVLWFVEWCGMCKLVIVVFLIFSPEAEARGLLPARGLSKDDHAS